jgi:hypothetical protein
VRTETGPEAIVRGVTIVADESLLEVYARAEEVAVVDVYERADAACLRGVRAAAPEVYVRRPDELFVRAIGVSDVKLVVDDEGVSRGGITIAERDAGRLLISWEENAASSSDSESPPVNGTVKCIESISKASEEPVPVVWFPLVAFFVPTFGLEATARGCSRPPLVGEGCTGMTWNKSPSRN